MELGSVQGAALDALAAATSEPARHVEHGAETATVQAFGRNDATLPSAVRDALARGGDPALPATAHAAAEFALPADQMVPATLTGLQAQPAWTHLLPPPMTLPPADDERAARRTHDDGDDDPESPPGEDDDASEATTPDSGDTVEVLDPDDDDCERLSGALQALLETTARAAGTDAVRIALLDQWRRGRCAVLACPQGADADGPAWAFVLRLRRAAARPPGAAPHLLLRGRRVAARLQWRLPPAGLQWRHVRMAKDHHPQRGRQLVPLNAAGAAVPCDVQLGPVLAERRPACDVRLRVDAVRRFWGALGDQWSVLVIVCSLPLVGHATEVSHDDR
jgi:hypothetical protein